MKSSVWATAMMVCAGVVHARDSGYALECTPVGAGQNMIISFLEDDTDKVVRYLETSSGTFWDSHEWTADKFILRSYMRASNSDQETVVSQLELERKTMNATFRRTEESGTAQQFQCVRWVPKSSNKGIDNTFDHLKSR